MSNLGIVTMHSSHNYGAVLQSYALQIKLRDLGYNSEIIDYTTIKEKEIKSLFLKRISINSLLHNLRTLSNYSNRKKRYSAFEDFIQYNLKLSNKTYHSINELKNENFKYDCFVTGSDQTFNLYLGGNKEERLVYYLSFIKNIKKIAYASSFGEHLSDFTEDDINKIKQLLSQYSKISIRENSGIEFLKKHMNIDVQMVLDPTMLMTKFEWEKVLSEKTFMNGEYIFYYSVLADKWSVNQAKRLSKLTNLPIVVPHLKNRFEINTKFIRCEDSGPREFIGLIKNAKFVCTTSFHGTVFSILFNKPFSTLRIGKGSRVTTLLNKLKLGDRIVNHNDNINIKKLFDIDFEPSNDLIAIERKKSLDFLVESINF